MFRIFFDQADNGSGGTNETTEATATTGSAAESTGTETESTGSETEGTQETAETEGGETAEGAEGAEAAPAFKANYKYTGDSVEKEVPEYLRPLIKDAESEKQIKTLLAKADGLDTVKQRQEVIRQERDSHKSNFEGLASQVNDARETYQRGDIDMFLKKLDIPEQRMLQWAIDKVKYNQLPPEQKQILDDKRAAERQVFDLQKGAKTAQEGRMSLEAQNLQTSLNYEIAKPEVASFQKAFDDVVGKPGAFLNEVRTRGELAWNRSGGKTILPVDQVIQDVMNSYANIAKMKAAAPQMQQAASTSQGATTAAKKPASTIPNVSGKSASPLNTKPKNLDEVRALAKRAAAGELPNY